MRGRQGFQILRPAAPKDVRQRDVGHLEKVQERLLLSGGPGTVRRTLHRAR